jgi:hypothetical protein
MTFRIAFLSVCLGLFVVNSPAQETAFPNEIDGLQFTKQEKFKDLKLLVSTRDNVIAAFGEKCVNGCDYDNDWKIDFAYVDEGWSITDTIDGVNAVFKPRPEFVGKLASFTFRPRRTVVMPRSTKPSGLMCSPAASSQGSLAFKSVVCMDKRSLSYVIYDEDNEAAKFHKNEIAVISYSTSEEANLALYARVGDTFVP